MNETSKNGKLQNAIKVALIGGSRLFGEALAEALGAEADLCLLGWSLEPEEGVEATKGSDPGVILVHIPPALGDAANMVAELNAALPRWRLLAFGGELAEESVLTLIEAGASKYLPIDSPLSLVSSTVKSVYLGTVSHTPRLITLVLSRIRQLSNGAPLAQAQGRMLTEREKEVMYLISQGLGNKDIALRLGVSTSTAKNHVHALLHKLNTHRRRDAIVKAFEAEVLTGSFPHITLPERVEGS